MSFTASDGTQFDDRDAWRKYEFETNYTFKNKKDETLMKLPGQIQGQPFDIADLEGCQVFLLDHSDQVQIDNLVNCRVYVGPCSESVFVRNCQNCTFTIACKQLRTRDCLNIQLSLYSLTDPIIETSSNVLFSSFNAAYQGLRQQFEAARLEPENNHWTQVYDFNDPDKTGVNWKLSHEPAEPWIIPLEQLVENADTLGPVENPVPVTAQAFTAADEGLQSFSIHTSQEDATAAVNASNPTEFQNVDDFAPAPHGADASFYEEPIDTTQDAFGAPQAPVYVQDEASAYVPAPVATYEPEPVQSFIPEPVAPAPVLDAQKSWPLYDEFEAKLAAEVEKKRTEEENLIKEVKSKAEEDLDKYYGERTDKLAHRAATNREHEEEKKKSQDLLQQSATEQPWNRVTDLVDTTATAPKTKTDGSEKKDGDDLYDTSRMRSLLLQLKNPGGPEAMH